MPQTLRPGHFKQYGIKIITAKLADTATGNDRVVAARQADRRAIDGSATEVVNQKVLPLVRYIFTSISMCILDAGGGRFIEDPDNVKAGETKTFDGQEALVAVGIRGYSNSHF